MPDLESFGAFISYGHADRKWVRVLAENLERLGVRVFFDEWEIAPGDVLVHRLDEGILRSASGLLVMSPTSVTRPWVKTEYAAMMTRAVEGGQRLIPVLLGDAEMPPLLASRVWIDFRTADGPEYEQRVRELADTLKGTAPARPAPGGALQPPPGTGFRGEGVVRCRLRIGRDAVVFADGKEETQHEPRGLTAGGEDRLWQLERARRRGPAEIEHTTRDEPNRAGAIPASLHQHLLEVGAALTAGFLQGSAGDALRARLAEVERTNATLELSLEIPDPLLAALPWETLRLPTAEGADGEPLALHRCVHLHRHVEVEGPTPALSIPRPLRILVAIGSPESQSEHGELLDYERELARILEAVEPARAKGRGAYVRILHRGTVAALREALEQQRFHVLHISCHASPEALVLEDEEGREDRVDANRFGELVLPPDRGVPLVVLSGCSTARSAAGPAPGEEQ